MIFFSELEHENFRDSKAEVALHFSGLLLVDVKHRSHLGIIAFACCSGVEYHFVAHFLSVKFSFLVGGADIFHWYDGLGSDATFFHVSGFVKLHYFAFHQSSVVDLFARLLRAEATEKGFVLLLHHLIVDGDVVVSNLNSLVYCGVKVGSQAHFKGESKLRGVEIQLLNVGGQRLAKHGELFIVDIFEESINGNTVEHVGEHLLAKHLFEQSCRHVTRTEAVDMVFLPNEFKVFLYFLLIVILFQRHCDNTCHIAVFLHCYIHIL